MQISGANQVHGPQSINAAQPARQVAAPTTSNFQVSDQLELSPAAQFVDQIHDMPAIRQDRVSEIRSQIAAGTYDTPDKMDAAMSRLLNELA